MFVFRLVVDRGNVLYNLDGRRGAQYRPNTHCVTAWRALTSSGTITGIVTELSDTKWIVD